MRYACLIYYNPKTLFGGSPEAKAVLAECSTHDDKLKESGHFIMGEALETPNAEGEPRDRPMQVQGVLGVLHHREPRPQ